MTRYFLCLLFTAGMIAIFPLTVRSNDGTETKDNRGTGRISVGEVCPSGIRDTRSSIQNRNAGKATAIHSSNIGSRVERNMGELQKTLGKDRLSTAETRLYRVSAYCQNSCCCGEYADGITASGHRITRADYGRICAAPKSYKFGTKFDLGGGRVVVCEDRGGSIKAAGDTVTGKVLTHDRLDILMATHQEALAWGVKYLECKVIQAE